ncbi:unnamed protein product [Cylicocyclus nassatus]|uniref:glutathione transferase n=1 Tax=Cylicocyclus nassatus TaxID=53992 RepID=A0AA36MBI0_CYLNA|nr:unnamed protein product [Cylicocyclus nassatus]
MVQYRLTYFDGRGTAEIIRQIFAVAGEKFEDVRVIQQGWPKLKANTPFGQLPVLEIDGKQLAQSAAIARYLARKFGLAGKNPYEEAVVDSIVDQFKDFTAEIRPYLRVAMGFEQGDKDKLANDVLFPARDKFFGFMTKFLKENKSGYLVGDSLTFADLYLAEHCAEFAKKMPSIYDGFPEIKAHAERVRSNPALKKWLATRPETPF